ncbi:MFS transporter [Candidatus Uhrbacteria bacterium]|nr:MFS transporter [Candidatus Uhrbacteria bacterium]
MRFWKIFLALLPIWIYTFIFKFGAGLHYALLPTFGEKLFPLWIAGLLMGSASLIQMICDVPAGYFLDRFGYVRGLKVGTAFFCLAGLVLLFGLHPWTYCVSLACSAVGWLLFSPALDAYVLVAAERKFTGTYMALREMTESAGIVVGMALLAFVIHFSIPLLGLMIGSILLIGLVILGGVPEETCSVHEEKKIAHQSFYIRRNFLHHVLLALKKLNPVSTLLFLSNLSSAAFYGMVWFVIPLLIVREGAPGPLSFGLIVFDLSVLFVGFFIGYATDRWSKKWLVFWGLLLFAVMAFLLGFHFGWLFLVFGFLATTGEEMSSISLWAWLDHLDKDHSEDALISGVMSLAQDVGWMIGPALAGFLFYYVGPSWTIATGAGFIFITWAVSAIYMQTIPPLPTRISMPLHIPRRRRHKR